MKISVGFPPPGKYYKTALDKCFIGSYINIGSYLHAVLISLFKRIHKISIIGIFPYVLENFYKMSYIELQRNPLNST